MAITSDLDNIVKWFEEEVCPGILLKVPDDKVNDGGYSVQTAHPAAFAMYIPTQDRKPPDVAAPIPSLCVQLLKGKHAPGAAHRSNDDTARACDMEPGAARQRNGGTREGSAGTRRREVPQRAERKFQKKPRGLAGRLELYRQGAASNRKH